MVDVRQSAPDPRHRASLAPRLSLLALQRRSPSRSRSRCCCCSRSRGRALPSPSSTAVVRRVPLRAGLLSSSAAALYGRIYSGGELRPWSRRRPLLPLPAACLLVCHSAILRCLATACGTAADAVTVSSLRSLSLSRSASCFAILLNEPATQQLLVAQNELHFTECADKRAREVSEG